MSRFNRMKLICELLDFFSALNQLFVHIFVVWIFALIFYLVLTQFLLNHL